MERGAGGGCEAGAGPGVPAGVGVFPQRREERAELVERGAARGARRGVGGAIVEVCPVWVLRLVLDARGPRRAPAMSASSSSS